MAGRQTANALHIRTHRDSLIPLALSLSRALFVPGLFPLSSLPSLRRNLRPFDRHDWYVNRCGKEVKYVIDYYSFEQADPETGETSIDYFIDARPAPTLSGMYDRARLAFGKWKRGEKIW